MDTIRNISIGVAHGVWDSIVGMTHVFTIDAEIYKQAVEKEARKEKRFLERQERERIYRDRDREHNTRTPSPTPSSASAMERENQSILLRAQQQQQLLRNNSDERSLESILNKPKTPKEDKPKYDRKIAKQVFKCCLLNGGFTWASIVLFEYIFLPIVKYFISQRYGESPQLPTVWLWCHSILSIIFSMMWVLPIFCLSKFVSSMWFQDIANSAYRVRKGRPHLIPGIGKIIADFLFSLLVQILFLVQSLLVESIPMPYVAHPLYFVHVALLYSLYSFEYKWFYSGWELHRRLSYIENNWPYFLGFGLPLTFLTNMTNSVIVSSCIFSTFFPLFILSGNEAKPVVKTTDTPLRIFSPVIFVSNIFFNCSKSRAAAIQLQLKQQQKELYELQREKAAFQKCLQQQQQRDMKRALQNKSTSGTSTATSTPQYRYPQPPVLRTQSRERFSDITTERMYGGYPGVRPLIPTPIAPSSNASSSSSSLHRR